MKYSSRARSKKLNDSRSINETKIGGAAAPPPHSRQPPTPFSAIIT